MSRYKEIKKATAEIVGVRVIRVQHWQGARDDPGGDHRQPDVVLSEDRGPTGLLALVGLPCGGGVRRQSTDGCGWSGLTPEVGKNQRRCDNGEKLSIENYCESCERPGKASR